MHKGLGGLIARYLNAPVRGYSAPGLVPVDVLAATLEPCDVVLVEGNRRISVAIKYLTQSTWSHAALFVGHALGDAHGPGPLLVEADLTRGVRAAPVSELSGLHVRICRPVSLTEDDRGRVIAFAAARIGHQYDLKNVLDLARYLLPTPPVPTRLRRRMIALGSGDPTRAICSTMIAQAFQSVRYPVLPDIEIVPADRADCDDCRREILHIRHHSLFAPRDFDLSPYFAVVKPRIAQGFDYAHLEWAAPGRPDAAPGRPPA
ncbi:MAG TPA: YiiX/YebB-like N1pC/P60 family cysteine hydrolase [Usitatibacteraceae bacterium]|nr:YiiX/YebB-like N1pC/P60 family cysteine hydrolase [Usitatibacteraceae bacterium]